MRTTLALPIALAALFLPVAAQPAHATPASAEAPAAETPGPDAVVVETDTFRAWLDSPTVQDGGGFMVHTEAKGEPLNLILLGPHEPPVNLSFSPNNIMAGESTSGRANMLAAASGDQGTTIEILAYVDDKIVDSAMLPLIVQGAEHPDFSTCRVTDGEPIGIGEFMWRPVYFSTNTCWPQNAHLGFRVKGSHDRPSDLAFFLRGPRGASVALKSTTTGEGGQFTHTISPENQGDVLPAGSWTLFVLDRRPGVVGTVDAIEVLTPYLPPPSQPAAT